MLSNIKSCQAKEISTACFRKKNISTKCKEKWPNSFRTDIDTLDKRILNKMRIFPFVAKKVNAWKS